MSCTHLAHEGIFVATSHSTGVIESIALVALVTYDNGHDSASWIIESGSTHHMNGFTNDTNDFFNLILDGYNDVGSFVKGSTFGRKKIEIEIYPLQKGGLRTSFPRWGVTVL